MAGSTATTASGAGSQRTSLDGKRSQAGARARPSGGRRSVDGKPMLDAAPQLASSLSAHEDPGQLLLGSSKLGNLMRARIDSTSMAARMAVKSAAVIGESFSMRMLARVCPELGPQQLERAKAELLAEEIWLLHDPASIAGSGLGPAPSTLMASGALPQSYAELHFAHAIIHQVAYDSIPTDQRMALHAAVLTCLEDDLQASELKGAACAIAARVFVL